MKLCLSVQNRKYAQAKAHSGDAGSLTSAQQQIILDYENAYFTSTGNFDIQMPENLFCSETEKDVEKAI